ncbi:hypothetical protein JMJ55_19000 [Belnapia sp. T6]|uniref:Uncharacterized protein n=1 Tax=Belnapia mucosa TaxID=2804532 RepID=A0ABS1V6Y9_9PROT|nr:hypothetical protein [Belnapia mucosa]MBL6457426.1 hypothetical protein [Belnapia mucosa]
MSAAASITVRVLLAIRHRPGRNTVVTPGRVGGEAVLLTRADPALKALARVPISEAVGRRMLRPISEMAAAEKIEQVCLGMLLRLTLLAQLLGAVLDGRAPKITTLPAPLNIFPVKWSAQATAVSSPDRSQGRLGGTAKSAWLTAPRRSIPSA